MSLLLSVLVLNAPITSAYAQDAPEEEAEEEAAPPQTTFNYALSGTLWVQTTKTGVGAAIAHDHAVHSNGWTGTATWDTADASKCNVSISLPVSTLIVDEPSIRANVGLPEGPDAGDRETITEHMLADNQLNAGKYTTITYQSTSCSGTSGAVTVKGNLTIVGKAAPISANLNITADESSFAASGSFSANHSAWGITPYSALFGAIGNAEQLKFGLNVNGAPK